MSARDAKKIAALTHHAGLSVFQAVDVLSALAAAGYAVVPVEPTEAMRKAFWKAGYHQGDAFGQGYPAMLAAAGETQG